MVPCRRENTTRNTLQITTSIPIKGLKACQGAIQLPPAAMVYASSMHKVVWVGSQCELSIGGR